jgi:phosphopantetheinyl transferase (holo-ACP synthase)
MKIGIDLVDIDRVRDFDVESRRHFCHQAEDISTLRAFASRVAEKEAVLKAVNFPMGLVELSELHVVDGVAVFESRRVRAHLERAGVTRVLVSSSANKWIAIAFALAEGVVEIPGSKC